MKIQETISINGVPFPHIRDATPEEEAEIERKRKEDEEREKEHPELSINDLASAIVELAEIIGG